MIEFFPLIEKISDSRLKSQTITCWEEALKRGGWTKKDLDNIPFTLLPTTHKVTLVLHTNGVTESAIATSHVMAKSYESIVKVNMDILISGGILHDVGKVLEYAFEDGKFVKSKNGKLIRHPVSGAALAWELGLPDDVVHIIASHSYEGDKTPRTVEAILIHHADFTNFEALGGKA
jgi:putative nucleotidyltransferase with HDIG domain